MARSNVDVRLTTIEADLANLKQQVQAISETKKDWLDVIWGTFANDPLYDEAMELGRKYRESLRPKERSVKTNRKRATSSQK